jgi:hypothetical protein
MRNKPCILPTVTFAVVIGTMLRRERAIVFAELSPAVTASYESELRIEELAI